MSRGINLGKGFVAIVDDEDYEWLMQWKWYYHDGYACRTDNFIVDGKRKTKTLRMHRIIMNIYDPKTEVDHHNMNKLDNRRINLRVTDKKNNMRNKKKKNGKNTSKYKGVSYRTDNNSFRVRISNDEKEISIGHFTNEIAAANAYNYWAEIYHGEFARLNDVEYMSNWYEYKI